MNSNETIYPKAYYVIDEQAKNAYPMLAVRPTIYDNGHKISWEDSKGGIMRLEYIFNSIQQPSEEIEVTIGENKVWTFKVLTCDVYYNKMTNIYKGRDPKKYENDEDLQQFLLNRNFELEAYERMFG